jgi:hypothetical protein
MAAVSFLLLAALLSTGCGQERLPESVPDSAQGGNLVANPGDKSLSKAASRTSPDTREANPRATSTEWRSERGQGP